jgi:glutaredoxin 3
MADKHYVIITKKNCPYCDSAKRLLTANNMSYTEYDVAEHPDFKAFLYDLDTRTVPQIFTKDRWVGGYSELEEAFAYTDY